jgi:hypothetical protein
VAEALARGHPPEAHRLARSIDRRLVQNDTLDSLAGARSVGARHRTAARALAIEQVPRAGRDDEQGNADRNEPRRQCTQLSAVTYGFASGTF